MPETDIFVGEHPLQGRSLRITGSTPASTFRGKILLRCPVLPVPERAIKIIYLAESSLPLFSRIIEAQFDCRFSGTDRTGYRFLQNWHIISCVIIALQRVIKVVYNYLFGNSRSISSVPSLLWMASPFISRYFLFALASLSLKYASRFFICFSSFFDIER